MMTFTYDSKEYSFTDVLDFEDVHGDLLTESISEYNRRTLTTYVEAGDMVKLPDELGANLYLTAYNLHSFVTSIMKLSANGWELSDKHYCTSYGKFSYSVTMVRSPEYMKQDAEVISNSVSEQAAFYVEYFELAKATARATYEANLRNELKELGSIDARKRQIYRQLERFKEVA